MDWSDSAEHVESEMDVMDGHRLYGGVPGGAAWDAALLAGCCLDSACPFAWALFAGLTTTCVQALICLLVIASRRATKDLMWKPRYITAAHLPVLVFCALAAGCCMLIRHA